MTDPVVTTRIIPGSPASVFNGFTDGIESWWPTALYSASARSKETPKSLSMDSRIGGDITETCADGMSIAWATITAWTEGRRLTLDWFIGHDPDVPSRVDLRFEDTPGGTKLTLRHDRFQNEEARKAYATGWDTILTRFTDMFETPAAPAQGP